MNIPSMRLAWRGLRKRPGFTAAVVLTLGIGFAVAIAMFSALYGVALRPLQYPNDDRLVSLSTVDNSRGLRGNALSGAEAEAGLADVNEIEAFGALTWNGATFLGDGSASPQVLTGASVAGDFFAVFQLQPLLGRTLLPADVGSDRIVLGHGAWQTLTGGDPAIVGKTLRFEGFSAEVIGVMPADFEIPAAGMGFWNALNLSGSDRDPGLFENARFYGAVARVRDGVSPAQLDAALARHSQALAQRYPGSHDNWSLYAEPMRDRVVPPSLTPVLLALFLVGVLVLLIASGNVVNLLIARGLARLNELAVHQALGATLARVRRMLLLEATLLVLLAATLGLALAWLGLKLWIGLADSGLPRSASIALDLPVLLFAAVATLLVLLLVGGLPLLPISRAARAQQLRGRGAGQAQIGWIGRLTRVLPGVGVALSTAALATAAVVGLSAQRLGEQDLGFASEQIAVAHVFRNFDPDGGAALRQYADLLLDEAKSSGAQHVALMNSPPLSPVGVISVNVQLPGRPDPLPRQPMLRVVQGDVVGTLDMRMLQGRALAPTDRDGTLRVAMINQQFAAMAFGGADPLGQTIQIPPYGRSGDLLKFQVVGVFADMRTQQAATSAQPEVWLPHPQYPHNSMVLVARGGLPAAALLKPLQEAFWRVAPQQGIYRAYTLESELDAQLATPRFFARNAGSFAVLALLLGTVGIYGVVAFDLAQRRRDLALRAALGANARALGRWILKRGLLTLALGLSLGAVLGWSLIGLVRSQLFGVADTGLAALFAAAALVSLATLTVCIWLARQAGKTDPMFVLRHD